MADFDLDVDYPEGRSPERRSLHQSQKPGYPGTLHHGTATALHRGHDPAGVPDGDGPMRAVAEYFIALQMKRDS